MKWHENIIYIGMHNSSMQREWPNSVKQRFPWKALAETDFVSEQTFSDSVLPFKGCFYLFDLL